MTEAEKLSQEDLEKGLGALSGWELQGGKLLKTYPFKDFASALLFVNRVGALAEQQDHHPDIDIRYNKVKLTLLTHSASAITHKDLHLASSIDA